MQEACRRKDAPTRGVAMGLLQRLEMRQGQSLVMTPQFLQAIKLLQLSHLDLIAYVEAELERNPLLERAEPESTVPTATASGGEAANRRPTGSLRTSNRAARSFERETETGLDNVFQGEMPVSARRSGG